MATFEEEQYAEPEIEGQHAEHAEGLEADPNAEGDAELEMMKKQMQEMEEEAMKLKAMTEQVEQEAGQPGVSSEEIDKRSIYVGNVDYNSTPEELQEHFKSCGTINRVTILCDKYTGRPKGFAYIEFADPDAVANAQLLNESLFRGRQLKVMTKRTNLPGMAARGRGGRFRGSFRPSPGRFYRAPRGFRPGFFRAPRYRYKPY